MDYVDEIFEEETELTTGERLDRFIVIISLDLFNKRGFDLEYKDFDYIRNKTIKAYKKAVGKIMGEYAVKINLEEEEKEEAEENENENEE